MENVYIIGHKNPDTDSVCSAYAYADLKNKIDPSKKYIAARCGNLNQQTKFIFDFLNTQPPVFLKDIHNKVEDIMTKKLTVTNKYAPIMDVMKNIDKLKIRLTPVVENKKYIGIISILEIAENFMNKNNSLFPTYHFYVDNFEKVMDGFYFKKGEKDTFEASIVVGAMPYNRYLKRIENLDFKKTVLVVGKRIDIIEFAVKNQFPAIILTGFYDKDDVDIDFSDYKGTVFISEHDTAETLRRFIMSVPAYKIMNNNIKTIKKDDYVDFIKDSIIESEHKGLPVIDDNNEIQGLITRSDLLKKVSKNLILVDHNEISQSIDGAENANICEIIDHHRLGTPKTKQPIYFYAKPVGSTCTLVYQLYKINNINIDKTIASVLLSGILSDTIILKSPTTTQEDIIAVEELSKLSGLDYEKYGKEIFSATASLKQRNPIDVINADFKLYEEFSLKIGIGQVEVTNINELDDAKTSLLDALNKLKTEKSLNWAMLLVTDIISEDSKLIVSGMDIVSKMLAYRQIDEHTFDLPGVLSRKKQLLPEILRVAEEFHKEKNKNI